MGRMKQLIKKFSYDEIIDLCKKKGWRLPTRDEIKEATIEHEKLQLFWIDEDPGEDRETHWTAYSPEDKDKKIIANKKFLESVVVVKPPKNKQMYERIETLLGAYKESGDVSVQAAEDILKEVLKG